MKTCGKHPGRGFQLLELLVVTAIVGIFAILSIPPLKNLSAGRRVELAAGEVASALRQARMKAILHGTFVGAKFVTGPDGRVAFTLYEDGDGDGVRSRDIERGIDPPVTPPRRLAHLGADVRFGIPAGEPPRDPGDPRRALKRRDDPVCLNRSDLASFGPLGTSSPGSLYLTDGRRQLAVVRVLGRTGKVRVLRYDYEARKWH